MERWQNPKGLASHMQEITKAHTRQLQALLDEQSRTLRLRYPPRCSFTPPCVPGLAVLNILAFSLCEACVHGKAAYAVAPISVPPHIHCCRPRYYCFFSIMLHSRHSNIRHSPVITVSLACLEWSACDMCCWVYASPSGAASRKTPMWYISPHIL